MKSIRSLLNNRWVQHSVFWVLSFVVFWRLFGYNDFWHIETDLVYTFLFHLSIWWVTYLNLDLLLPRLFQRKQYLAYGLAVLVLLASGIGLNLVTFNYLGDWIFPGYYFISYHTWWDLFQILGVYLLATTLLKLSRSWFQLQEQERRLGRLEKQNLAAELASLRNQLHPHFLFNHLNTLYALALEEDPKTADYVVKLSDHLRHLTYGSRSDLISLEEELTWLKNYLVLQEVKGGRDYQLRIEGDTEDKRIPPLLLLPLVENAFKHGDLKKAPLSIRIQAGEERVRFELDNPLKGQANQQPGGIGLENVRRRLELLYADQFLFTARNKEDIFHVVLEIPYR